MKTYTIVVPGGRKVRVEASDESTREEATMEALRFVEEEKQREADEAAAMEESIRNAPAMEAGPIDAALIGTGRQFTQMGRGLNDLVSAPTREDMANREFERQAYERLTKESPIATGIGEMAPYVAGGIAGGVGKTVLGTALRQAAPGMAMEAAKPGTMGERAKRAAVEGILAGAGGAAGHALGSRLGGLAATERKVARTAGAEQKLIDDYRRFADNKILGKAGIEPTAAQKLGGAAARAEESAMSTPGFGDTAIAARDRAAHQYRLAQIQDIVEPIGAPKIRATNYPEAFGEAQKHVDEAFKQANELIPEGIIAPQSFVDGLNRLRGNLAGMSAETENTIERFIANKIEKRMSDGGIFEGDGVAKIVSEIGTKERGALDPEVKQVMSELRGLVSRMIGEVNKPYLKKLGDARASYAKLRTVEKAMNSRVATDMQGAFTPADILRQVRKRSEKAKVGAFALVRHPGNVSRRRLRT